MKPVVILPQAAEDIEAARDFYDRIDSGAGGYFVDCLLQDLDQLSRVHGFHRVQFGLHRMLSQRFPFGIYYRVQDECVQVFANWSIEMAESALDPSSGRCQSMAPCLPTNRFVKLSRKSRC